MSKFLLALAFACTLTVGCAKKEEPKAEEKPAAEAPAAEAPAEAPAQ